LDGIGRRKSEEAKFLSMLKQRKRRLNLINPDMLKTLPLYAALTTP